MKHTVIAVITALVSVGYSQAQITDFRGSIWGNTIEKIQATEKAPLVIKENNSELEYRDEIGGSACDVVYIFNDNNKLTSGLYVFPKKYSNPQLYLQDYKKFKKLLTEKYGKAQSENEHWNTTTPVIEKQNYGQAIADGNLTLNTVWNTDRTTIKIVLVTVDNHPSLQIHYTTGSLDELEDKAELKRALDKL